MDDFEREALARLPLAESVWTLLRYVVSPEFAAELFDQHRGTGYEGDVRFGVLVELVSDAILQHGGSGRRSFQAARANGRLAATTRAVYGKLSRVPLELSQVFLSGATQRLQEVLPTTPTCVLPESLRRFSVVVVDGKKIKGLAKRVKVLRDFRGKALGGKGVVALHLNTQLAIAMEASPDGEANDAPLTPGVLEQVRALLPDELLYVKDRQFCDLTIPALVVEQGSHFLIRYSKKMGFFPEKSQISRDRQGRRIVDEWGWLGAVGEKRRMYVRRVTLERPGEEEVSVVTDLQDAAVFPAQDLLDLYLQRWTIERMFQQVTEVFDLQHLIGSTPQGALFQFALCLLLYNVIQVTRGYVAELQQRSTATISSELLFRDVRDEMIAAAKFIDRAELIQLLDRPYSASQLRHRLCHLLQYSWASTWLKAPPRKTPRQPPPPKIEVSGGHFSAWKQIEAAKALTRSPKPP